MPNARAEAVAGIVLAAGRSRRFGPRNKLLQPLHGVPLLWHALAAACASQARPLIVVTGHQRERVQVCVEQFVKATRQRSRLRLTFNRDYRRGMAGSLQTGLRALPAGTAAAVICLGDMPQVTPRLIDRLIAAFRPEDAAVVPQSGGRRGNPVLLGARLFPALRGLQGDRGARGILKGRGDVRTIDAGSAALLDIDTRRAWRRISRASFRRS